MTQSNWTLNFDSGKVDCDGKAIECTKNSIDTHLIAHP